jgi:NAD dependent epimerase/dehydratase family enzyme
VFRLGARVRWHSGQKNRDCANSAGFVEVCFAIFALVFFFSFPCRSGGAYPAMAFPASVGLAATFGSGEQIFPWIHEDDLGDVLERALESVEWSGVVVKELISTFFTN